MVDLLLEFSLFWLAAYAIGATIMFTACLSLIAINKRHPERKSRNDRKPTRRARTSSLR